MNKKTGATDLTPETIQRLKTKARWGEFTSDYAEIHKSELAALLAAVEERDRLKNGPVILGMQAELDRKQRMIDTIMEAGPSAAIKIERDRLQARVSKLERVKEAASVAYKELHWMEDQWAKMAELIVALAALDEVEKL